jgi:membrane fusion protein, multidrug efflux system
MDDRNSHISELNRNNGLPTDDRQSHQFDIGKIDTLEPQSEGEQLPELLENDRPAHWKTAMAIVAVLLVGTLSFAGIRYLGAKPGSAAKEKPDKKLKITPVSIATAIQKTVPVQIEAIGTVQPGMTVSVTAQASGRINGVFFKKGQEIKKGQLLFTIDQEAQNAVIQQAQGAVLKGGAAVQQAQATRDKDTGSIAQAQATLERDLQLIQQARATLDKDIGAIAQAQATLEKDIGLIQQAKVTLNKDTGAVAQAEATLAKDLAQIQQAKALLARDKAQAQYIQAQFDRYNSLYAQGAASKDQAQQYTANKQASLATVQSDIEAIRNAEAVVRGDRIAIQNAKMTLQSDRTAIQNAQAVVQGDRAAVRNAEATVRGDRAAIRNAEAVVKGDRVAIENAKAVVRGDEAAIKNAQAGMGSDQGTLKNAQVQLAYTKIYAPIDGRAGNILVQMGNVVQPNSNTPLVTIVQVHPIQVSFAVPAANLPEVQKQMKGGKLPVSIKLSATDSQPISGLLSFVNNTVDNTTGTIQLIGDFDNTDGKLYPGQYANATLTLSETPNAIVIPSQAVQNGPNGQFVFVVKPDMSVENTPVVATGAADGLSAIQKGLKSGDKVVTDGQANLVSGGKVKLQERGSKNDKGGGKRRGKKADAGETAAPTDAKTGDVIPSKTTFGDVAPSGEKPRRRGGGKDRSSGAAGEKP